MMDPIIKTFKTQIKLEVHEVAYFFGTMNADEMAKFFNMVSAIYEFEKASLPLQLQAVTESPELNGKGRYVMSVIGDYSSAIEGE